VGSEKTEVNIRTLFITGFFLFMLIVAPMKAKAGVVSFFSSLFAKAEAQVEVENTSSSQNMALLQATISPNGGDFSKKEEVEIMDENSLVPEPVELPEFKSITDDQISLYVVRSGDTLPAIAKMFGVSVNTIRWGNDIKGNTITVGQTLVILPISGVQHTVKSGDTLQSIAKIHKGDLEEIMQYNNLPKNAKLAVGDIIVVPDGEMVTVTTPSKTNSSSSKAPVYEGYYMRPIAGGIKSQGVHGKNGVDLVSYYGANILASASGEVILARGSGYNGGYGSYIVIKHSNGTQTLYAHLSGVNVGVGERVSQGQVIGKMGNTGKSTGTHLHFEVRGARNPF